MRDAVRVGDARAAPPPAPSLAPLALAKLLAGLAGATSLAVVHAFHPLTVWQLFGLSLALFFGLALWSGATREHAGRKLEPSFGQYTLVRKLGEGGMGVVYEARHALLRRPTALKLLRKQESQNEAEEREAAQRFEREVQLTSQLSHPNTIVVYDYGQSDDGALYYAMEYIDGIDLDRLVRINGPLSAAHVIHLALQVCGSLAEAHARSLIHRDIKPSNLLVYERAGVPDTIKVVDFGLVKSLHGPIVSAAHVLVGTPLYMAPELLADPSRAGPRGDIYALGAVLHWLATGRTLQEAAVLGGGVLSSVPLDLERVIMRCTEADPSERPESMDALADELRQCRDYDAWTPAASRAYWELRGKRLSRLLAEPARADANTLAAS